MPTNEQSINANSSAIRTQKNVICSSCDIGCTLVVEVENGQVIELHTHDPIGVSNPAVEPPGACKSVFYFWREMALRTGFAEHFPWRTVEELYDYRLSPLGMTFEEFSLNHIAHGPRVEYKKYEKTGFATPSGKVELSSSVLESFGFDPLSGYREAPGPDQILRPPSSPLIEVRAGLPHK